MKKVAVALLLPAILFLAAGVTSGEERQYKRWKLEFERGKLDFVSMEDALGQVKLCWYLTYKVTNKSEAEVPLRVAVTAKTDTKLTYRDTIAPLAQMALEEKTGKKRKNSLAMYSGKLAPGKSVEAVAFFGELDPNFDELKIHVAGLYDTIEQVEGELFYEKKVLVMTFDRPGDEFGAATDAIDFKGQKWVIEGERRKIPQKPIR